MLFEDLVFGYAACKPAENVIDCDPHSADAWFTIPLTGFDRDTGMRSRHVSIRLSRIVAPSGRIATAVEENRKATAASSVSAAYLAAAFAFGATAVRATLPERVGFGL